MQKSLVPTLPYVVPLVRHSRRSMLYPNHACSPEHVVYDTATRSSMRTESQPNPANQTHSTEKVSMYIFLRWYQIFEKRTSRRCSYVQNGPLRAWLRPIRPHLRKRMYPLRGPPRVGVSHCELIKPTRRATFATKASTDSEYRQLCHRDSISPFPNPHSH